MKLKFFLLSLLLISACAVNAQRAAVFEFKGNGLVTQQNVEGISAMFTTYFRPAGYTMVERDQIDKVIDEQGFQRQKSTESEMVKVGKILNVSKIIVGDVSMVMGQLNVDARVINVENGTIEATEGVSVTNATYRESVMALAQRLAEKLSPTSKSTGKAVGIPQSYSPLPSKYTSDSVITLYGYLKVFPSDLGVFDTLPAQVIRNLNAVGQYDYCTWRVPTSEELSLMRSHDVIPANDPYVSSDGRHSGRVRLVTDDVPCKEVEARRAEIQKQRLAEAERQKVIIENQRQQQAAQAEQQRIAAEAERQRLVAEAERQRVEAERVKAEQERQKALPKKFTANGVSFEMIYVKGGSFVMGGTPEQGSDCNSDEKPTHNVTLSDYYIGQYEVTQALWQAVMGKNPSNKKGDNLPVENVSWLDVQDFIRALNQLTGQKFGLPTEAQWEYAARGGSKSKGYKYSGGNVINNVGWSSENSGNQPHPVGTRDPNELGLYDMSGNVWEWCYDFYGNYTGENQTDPLGPASGTIRVLRGGSWSYFSNLSRVSYRLYGQPSNRFSGRGFRLVLVP